MSFREWRDDTQGSIAVVFGLTALVLVAVIGAAIDYSRAGLVQSSLQRAVDATALLAAKNHDVLGAAPMSDATATDYVRQTFSTDKIADMQVNVTFQVDRAIVTGRANVPTTFANVMGIRNVPVSAIAEAVFPQAEIVLVLDNTGSMNDANKLPTLKRAATNFLDKMQSSPGSSSNVRIGIVPFDTDVNLGNLKSSNWVDASQSSPWTTNPSTAGCIWDRAEPYDVSDVAPTSSATMFSADGKRTGACSLAPVTPLTKDFSALRAVIDSMAAGGTTNLTIGLVWGLHLLTPSEPITNAVPLGTRNVTKYIIFMTDGLNNRSRTITANGDSDVAMVNKLNDRTRQVCSAIRDAGIQVFTARIIQGDATILRDCATASSMYYDVQDVSQLQPVFSSIYDSIMAARIAR